MALLIFVFSARYIYIFSKHILKGIFSKNCTAKPCDFAVRKKNGQTAPEFG